MSRLVAPFLIATLLATAGCGRMSGFVPTPPSIAPLRAALAPDLPGAVAAARAAIKDPDAKPLLIAAYGVTPAGKFANSLRAGWVIGLAHSRGDGTKASTVSLDWNGSVGVRAARLPEGPQGAALMPTVLASMPQAMSWAHAAGAPKAAIYTLAYIADKDGPAIAVAEAPPAGADLQDEARKVLFLDASTGKPILPAAPAAAEAPAEPAAEPDTPEATAAFAALAAGRLARR